MVLSMIVLYALVLVTGAAALLPLSSGLRNDIVEGHLVASIWAGVPTGWQIWTYRRRLVASARTGLSSMVVRRQLVSLVVLAGPILFFATVWPRPVSQLSRADAGGTWVKTGPRVFVDRLMDVRGNTVAGGDGLYAKSPRGWRQVGPFSMLNLVLGMSVPGEGPVAIWVGTTAGLYAARDVTGPYLRVPLPAHDVHAIAVTPGRPNQIWASSNAGFLRSDSGGLSWAGHNLGVRQPETAWALKWFHARLYASDQEAVYAWTGEWWKEVSGQFGVVSLDTAGRDRLFSSSMGDGLRELDRNGWKADDGGLPVHNHGSVRGIHVLSLTWPANGAGPYVGTMTDGAATSIDSARSWVLAWPGLRKAGVVWRVLPVGNTLMAATDTGLLSYQLPPGQPATWTWWLFGMMVTGAGTIGALALGRRKSW